MKAGLIQCVIVVAALSGVSATRQAADTVPEYLVAATERPLADFLVLVANASIRAGLEVKEADNGPRSAVSGLVPPKGEITQIPREQLVTAFNARRPGYHAGWVGDVLLIRPVMGRMEFLDSPSPIQLPTTIVGLMKAIRTIFSPIKPESPNAVSVGSVMGNEAGKALFERFTLHGSNRRTVIDTLNQLTLQHPGAWWVTTRLIEDKWQPTEIGFVYSDFARSRVRMMP
jgi:hypothetical protein